MTAYINREPLKVVAQIIQEQLGLDVFHVIDATEKFDIPVDQGLFVVLFDEGPSIISRSNWFDPSTNSEVQTHTMLHPIRIEICSFNHEARQRKEEVALALDSIYAQQLMEQYQCQVSSMTGKFQDASAAEPSSFLKRYSTVVNVMAIHGKVQPVDYFDKFNGATVAQTVNPPEVHQS